MTDDQRFMRMALRLARRGKTSPNPLVGAVVVKNGEVIGRGYHPKAGEPHGEVFALADAGDDAVGATLYVTLEPCCHHGRTPPCVDAVIASGVKRVVAAMEDPNPRVSGRGVAALREAGIAVEVGILEQEARELNQAFIKHITTGKPFVTLKMAMTLDGKIAAHSGDSRWVSGEKSRCMVQGLRKHADAVVIGAGTMLADDPLLTVRGASMKWQPARVIVDEKAAISPKVRVFKEPGGQVYVATTTRADAANVRQLEEAGARILMLDESDGLVDLSRLCAALADLGMINILLEGGGELSAGALDARIVDKVIVFIAPKIVGGRAAKTPVEGPGAANMADALRLTDVKTGKCGDDLVVSGRPVYHRTGASAREASAEA